MMHGHVTACLDAHIAYAEKESKEAMRSCQEILQSDPGNVEIVSLYIVLLMEAKKKNSLFLYAHQLHKEPTFLSFYAIGCYFLLIEHYNQSRRYLYKCTQYVVYFFFIDWHQSGL